MNRGRVVPTRRLSLAAAAAVGPVALAVGVGVRPWWVAVISATGLLVVLALVDAVLAVSPLVLGVERIHPGALARGERSTMRWVITNPAQRGVRVAFVDGLLPSLNVSRRGEALLEARESLEIEHEMQPSRRGRFDLGPLTLRCAGPLGMAARQRDVDLNTTLRVLPPFRARRAMELRMRMSRVTHLGLRTARGRGSGTEFEQLREYVPGDDPRHIDWNATARSDKPIVRSFNVEQQQRVTVLLDCGRTMAARVDGAPVLEQGMDLAVAFATVVTRSHDRIALTAYDSELRAEVGPGSGPGQVGRITEAVFGLEPRLLEADHAGAFATATLRSRRRSLVVVITDLNTAVVEEYLVPAIAEHAIRHLVVVAAVRDPRLDEWASAEIFDRPSLHLAGSAAAALAARERAALALTEVGAVVIDEPPERCAARLVDAYLDLKSSARW